MKIAICVFAVSVVIGAKSFAQDRISFGNRTYPVSVTLADTLSSPKVQTYGNCHVHAAVAAAEAACFRKTGKKFDLSVAYLFYRHIRTLIENPNSDFFLSGKTLEFFSENDPGYPETTLERIKNGSVMLESEFRMYDFNRAIAEPLKLREAYWKKFSPEFQPEVKKYEAELRAALAKRLDIWANGLTANKMKQLTGGWSHIVFDHPNHPLHACRFDQLKIESFEITPERAVALITNNIPIVCSGRIGPSQADGHAMLYAGYEYDPRSEFGVSFQVRDSRLAQLLDSGWRPVCDRATVVYYPEETERVQSSIRLR